MDLHNFLNGVVQTLCTCTEQECHIMYPGKPTDEPKKMTEIVKNMATYTTGDCNVINTAVVGYPQFNSKIVARVSHMIPLSVCGKSEGLLQGLASALSVFKRHKLIYLSGNHVTLYSDKLLSWTNIQGLDDAAGEKFKTRYPKTYETIMATFASRPNDVHEFVWITKSLFWFLRKFIVDTVLTIAINATADSEHIYPISVGSTNITSDYDITLYGDHDVIAAIIQWSEHLFATIFGFSSSVLFDTNFYGLSFVSISPKVDPDSPIGGRVSVAVTSPHLLEISNPKTFTPYVNCQDKSVYVLNTNAATAKTQHVWALIALLNAIFHLSMQMDSDEYNDVLNEIRTNFKAYSLIRLAQLVILTLKPSRGDGAYYNSIIGSFKTFQHAICRGLNPILVQNNFISFANYHGVETYIARGTFLDVVANQQMCKNVLHITRDEYLDSYIENMANLIIHPTKIKYGARAQHALKGLGISRPLTQGVLGIVRDVCYVCNQILDDKYNAADYKIFTRMITNKKELYQVYNDEMYMRC